MNNDFFNVFLPVVAKLLADGVSVHIIPSDGAGYPCVHCRHKGKSFDLLSLSQIKDPFSVLTDKPDGSLRNESAGDFFTALGMLVNRVREAAV